jgi:enterochelin esterase family protein
VYDPNEEAWLIRQFVASPKLPLRLYLEVGLLERSATDDMVVMNRRMRDVLEAKGYEVAYSEYNGGHDYICWRGSLADGLVWLTGARTQ